MTDKKKEADKIPGDIAKMSFEEGYSALKTATDLLEGEEVDLEATLREYARASSLARHCANLLDAAEERIRILIESEGVIQLTNFDTEETV